MNCSLGRLRTGSLYFCLKLALIMYFVELSSLQKRVLRVRFLAAETISSGAHPPLVYMEPWGDSRNGTIGRLLPRAPSFIIVGAQKCGTTALLAILSQHPTIVPSIRPEAHFFDRHGHLRKNMHRLNDSTVVRSIREKYSQNFRLDELNTHTNWLSFEKTPSYLVDPEIPRYIRAIVPWSKVIVVLRNPVARLLSHYNMRLARITSKANVTSTETLEQVLADELRLLRHISFPIATPVPFTYQGDPPSLRKAVLHWRTRSMLYRGCYADQLQHWLRHYTIGENLVLVQYERYEREPAVVMEEILQFVGAPAYQFPDEVLHARYTPVLDDRSLELSLPRAHNSTIEYLLRFYKRCNNDLANLVGEDWRGVWDA
jgi:hypothetical protein